MVYNELWNTVGICHKIGRSRHRQEKEYIKNFILFSKSNKQKNNEKHLKSDKNVLPVKTEWIVFKNTVTRC
jgi:hypothetical protein